MNAFLEATCTPHLPLTPISLSPDWLHSQHLPLLLENWFFMEMEEHEVISIPDTVETSIPSTPRHHPKITTLSDLELWHLSPSTSHDLRRQLQLQQQAPTPASTSSAALALQLQPHQISLQTPNPLPQSSTTTSSLLRPGNTWHGSRPSYTMTSVTVTRTPHLRRAREIVSQCSWPWKSTQLSKTSSHCLASFSRLPCAPVCLTARSSGKVLGDWPHSFRGRKYLGLTVTKELKVNI